MRLPPDAFIDSERYAIREAAESGRNLFTWVKNQFQVEASILREHIAELTPPVDEEDEIDEQKNEKLVETQIELEEAEERYRQVANLVLVQLVSELEAQLKNWFERRSKASLRRPKQGQSWLQSLSEQYKEGFAIDFQNAPAYTCIRELVAARNCVVHERGCVNDEFLRQFPHPFLIDGQKIVIGEGRLDRCIRAFEDFLTYIHTPLPPPELRRTNERTGQ